MKARAIIVFTLALCALAPVAGADSGRRAESAPAPPISCGPDKRCIIAKPGIRSLAAPKGPLGHSGRWITDRRGRVVILHGFNMVYKRPPYAPDEVGFGADDADFLKRYGFNTIRLGLIYKAVEPEPGVYNDAYLARIARTERQLAKRGIFTQLDYHQDLYNERFSGEGWPDWAVLDDGFPAEPLSGFPGSYISSPGLNRAFDNFWANAAGPGGVGLQDRYAAAWRHTAELFRDRPRMMGYDLMNEPWPGTPWTTCANTAGCPAFDNGVFTDFYERTIAAIRQVDQRNLVWYEPNVVSTFGADSNVDSLADRRLGYSFHVYCIAGALGGPGGGEACGTSEDLTFDNADKQAQQTGSALLLSEFAATDDLETIRRVAGAADDHMVSWQEWHYCGCADPTTQGPGDVQAIVLDPAKPPRGDNIKREKLRLLARPYPQVLAGTPQSFSFDPATGRFKLDYLTRRASGKGRFRRGLTDVFVPKLHYPKGYRLKITGAKRVGRRKGQHVILRANRRAKRVTAVITPR